MPRNRPRLARALLCVWFAFAANPAAAILTIQISKGTEARIPIAVVPFAWEDMPQDAPEKDRPADIIQANLTASGRFDAIAREDFLSRPHDLESVSFKDWRLLKAEALVVGRVINTDDDFLEVRFRLIDVFGQQQLAGKKFVSRKNQLRATAHQISDIIYEQLTGKPGAFNTRIAYVTVTNEQSPNNKRFLLQIADADGHAAKTILQSPEPILSPAWSPDGNQLAYVSFEKKRSMVFVQDIWSGARELLSEFGGLNSAPAWSPDGAHLALTLSRDGNPEIYIYRLADKKLRRLTQHTAIDTEPAWSPDGESLIFTSSRSGAPQIYQVSSAGGAPKRLTFEGDYNAGASYSPDGERIVLITNQGNGFRVGLYSAEDRTLVELTDGEQDESPSFAPNSEMIIYATRRGVRGILAAVSTDGGVRQTLKLQDGSVREPAWSPYNR